MAENMEEKNIKRKHIGKYAMQQPKRLYLSNKNRKIAGFCGGLAEYLNVDPTVIRVIYVFFTLISMGVGILLYVIAWLIIPRNPKE